MYGWLNAYVHYKRHNSMAEDSLILPASDYYVFRNDTAKNLFSYQLKAWYWYWLKEHERKNGIADKVDGVVECVCLERL